MQRDVRESIGPSWGGVRYPVPRLLCVLLRSVRLHFPRYEHGASFPGFTTRISLIVRGEAPCLEWPSR